MSTPGVIERVEYHLRECLSLDQLLASIYLLRMTWDDRTWWAPIASPLPHPSVGPSAPEWTDSHPYSSGLVTTTDPVDVELLVTYEGKSGMNCTPEGIKYLRAWGMYLATETERERAAS